MSNDTLSHLLQDGCLAESAVLDFLDEQLPPAEMAAIARHIDVCAGCRSLLAEMARANAKAQRLMLVFGDDAQQGRPPRDETAGSHRSCPGPGPGPGPGHEPSAAASHDQSPFPSRSVTQLIDYYRLIGPLGRGAAGLVYRGHDMLLDRPVAIKFLVHEEPSEAERLRLLEEARTIARLRHPNVVTIHHVGEVDGEPYLVMELLEGQTLRQLRRPLAGPKVLDIAFDLARGLAAVHRQGVLHRDIKSSNVMLTEEGQVKLIDFGLAKAPHAAGQPANGHPGPPLLPTREGTLQGTLAYLAPERFSGAPASCRSDVYALGVVLHELAVGFTLVEDPARALTDQALQQNGPPEVGSALRRPALGLHPALAQVIERCLAADPAQRFASGEEVLAALHRLRPRETRVMPVIGNPYRGLRTFEAEHRDVFFGRDDEISEVLERLQSAPLVLVTGDSGLGKSSLCRAGVLPQVAQGCLGGGRRRWRVVQLVPGQRPLAALAAALGDASAAPETAQPVAYSADRLALEPEASARAIAAGLGAEQGLLLFIDQLEELFTIAEAMERAALGRLLGALAALAADRLRILGTVRGDFWTRLATLEGLDREVGRALYVLRPLGPEGLRQAVVEPANRRGVQFASPAMVEALVASVERNPGALPLLAFTLAALWQARDEAAQVIPAAALAALGGVGGALARHGDGMLASLQPAERSAARRILLGLVSPQGTRVRTSRGELGGEREPELEAALDALVRGRLVVAAETPGGATYELAHEALIERWETLRTWLAEARSLEPVRRRLSAAAAEWERLGGSTEGLWQGKQLGEANALDARDLGAREQRFLAAAYTARRRRQIGWVAVGLMMLGGVVLFAWDRAQQARTRRTKQAHMQAQHIAQARAHLAEVEQLSGDMARLRQEALALFDRAGPADLRRAAETLWDEARERSRRIDALLVRGEQEASTGLDTDRQGEPDSALLQGLVELVGELLYRRILLAEMWWRPEQASELKMRLKRSDPGGRWQRTLDQPAQLTVNVMPAEAVLVLERYPSELGQGRAHTTPVATWSGRPQGSRAQSLAAGSYLLQAEAPGRVKVRYPLMLGRGESYAVTLRLPSQAEVPPGYVYIPAGRTLFGSNDDNNLRRGFFGAPPLHAIETEQYLIGRTEVTFGSWLEFLATLDPAERRARLPRGIDSNSAVVLKPIGHARGAWQYDFAGYGKHLRAQVGERVHYPDRRQNAVQDWLRFPVLGISANDAHAYTRWLDRSGRLRGARLCSEREWERAARGADGRQFPHGDDLLPSDANFDETYGRKDFGPDEVGLHPASDSPFGVADLAGNAWEWVTSVQDPQDAVHRGGAWYLNKLSSRSVNREIAEAQVKTPLIGMRVCASMTAR